MTRELRDKVIVITGASSGIGAATAERCGARGMKVVLAARRIEKLHAVAQRVEAAGGEALAVACDVDHDEPVRALFDAAWERFGRLDAAFANAGYGLKYPVLDTPDHQHRALFETNYFGTVRTLKAALPRIENTPGGLAHLLICSSAASEIGPPRMGPYAATKAAQDAIADAMRAELASRGIAVTSVHPVGTRTEFFDTAQQRSGKPDVPTNTPGPMMQTADHVAAKIVRALERPRAQVWPMPVARLGLALCTAWPGLAAAVLKRMAKRQQTTADGSP